MLLEIRIIRVISRKEGLQRLGSTGLLSASKNFFYSSMQWQTTLTHHNRCATNSLARFPLPSQNVFHRPKTWILSSGPFRTFVRSSCQWTYFSRSTSRGKVSWKKTQNNKLGSPSRSILWTVSMKTPSFETLWNLVLLQLAFQDKKKNSPERYELTL